MGVTAQGAGQGEVELGWGSQHAWRASPRGRSATPRVCAPPYGTRPRAPRRALPGATHKRCVCVGDTQRQQRRASKQASERLHVCSSKPRGKLRGHRSKRRGAGGGGAATVADGLGVARVGVHVAHVGERDLRVGHLAGVAREVLRRVERHLIHVTCTAQHSTHVDSMAMRRHERLSTENKHHHDVCGEDRL